jgi:uncharacterized protein YbbC (DUF1343 family)
MIYFKHFKNTYLFLFLFLNFQLISCAQKSNQTASIVKIKTGAEKINIYLPLLKGKNIAIVANQTSVIEKREKKKEKRVFTHVVDSLLSLNIKIKKVFAPEHGFRGKADAGEIVKDGFDAKTGLQIVSLYGKNKKPSTIQLMLLFLTFKMLVLVFTPIFLHYIMSWKLALKWEFL